VNCSCSGPSKADRTPASVLLFALLGIVTAFYVAEDVSPQAVHAENVEDLQESITAEGIAGQPFRNPSSVEIGVFLAT
jgi:hypothetical protein